MSGAQDLLLGNFSTAVAGYQIERSLRFNSADSAYLNRTFGSAPTNDDKATISLWVKRTNPGAENQLYSARASGAAAYTSLRFDSTDELDFLMVNSSSTVIARLVTTAKYRDPSAWYHIVFAYDSTDATSSNRLKLYVNGVQVTVFNTATYPAQNTDLALWAKNTVVNYISREGDGYSSYLNGYLTEINFIDGQALTPSDFGETDSATGVWKPKAYTGTYGTNGFYLPFSDNASTTTLGDDFSGNNNDWTTNNFSVTAGAGNDSLVDSPTSYGTDTGVGGEVRGNYATLNPLDSAGTAPSNGNLEITTGATWNSAKLSMYVTAGTKTYIECKPSVNTGGSNAIAMGVGNASGTLTGNPAYSGTGMWGVAISSSQQTYTNSSTNVNNTLKTTCLATDVMCMAIDATNYPTTTYVWIGFASGSTVTWYYNTNQSGGDPTLGASGNPTFTISGANNLFVYAGGYSITNYVNAGQRPFQATPPSGFKALCTTNLPTPTIGATSTTQANDYMNVVLYTGTGSSLGVTGVGFQPDWVWIKERSGAADHGLYDAVRGVQNQLESNTTTAETTEATGLTAFGADGFTVGALAQLNTSADTYVAWNWNAGGSNATNTSGTITSTVRANTTSGFSIVTYTGTGSASDTVGHGLGVTPAMVITKRRSSGSGAFNWLVKHSSLASNHNLLLESTSASTNVTTGFGAGGIANLSGSTTFGFLNGTDVTPNNVNTSGATYVAYCFAPVAGYSAFGSYTGNASTDGPFIYTGFRPRYVMIKRSDSTSDWTLLDTSRSTYNVVSNRLWANLADAELTNSSPLDIVSNGFKLRITDAYVNANTGTYIYAAFAESPFKYSLAR